MVLCNTQSHTFHCLRDCFHVLHQTFHKLPYSYNYITLLTQSVRWGITLKRYIGVHCHSHILLSYCLLVKLVNMQNMVHNCVLNRLKENTFCSSNTDRFLLRRIMHLTHWNAAAVLWVILYQYLFQLLSH